jgi:DNA-binding transcriptional LysR family regulator
MNIRSLEHLLAVAETGSFSKAAERCFITQSALSRSIQNLESDLGGQLLDRIGKRNELTPLGQQVVERSRGIVREAAELKRGAELLQDGAGLIRVGLGSGPGALLVQPLMRLAAEQHPRVRVNISRGPTELQLVQLRARQLDAMVVDARRVQPAPDLRIEALGELRAGFICRADHPLARKRQVSMAHMLAYPLAGIPLSAEVSRTLLEQYGPGSQAESITAIVCEDITALIATVEQSQAIYLGIVAAAREGLQAGRLCELKVEPKLGIGARFAYVTLSGRTEAPVMKLLRQLVQEHLRDEPGAQKAAPGKPSGR